MIAGIFATLTLVGVAFILNKKEISSAKILMTMVGYFALNIFVDVATLL